MKMPPKSSRISHYFSPDNESTRCIDKAWLHQKFFAYTRILSYWYKSGKIRWFNSKVHTINLISTRLKSTTSPIPYVNMVNMYHWWNPVSYANNKSVHLYGWLATQHCISCFFIQCAVWCKSRLVKVYDNRSSRDEAQ